MDNTDLKTEPPFVKMSINVILTGAISKASGGDFYQGAMRALVVYLYNDMKAWERVLGKRNMWIYHVATHPLTAAGGAAQVVAGEALCDTGVGCLLGGPLMAHGANNLQEAFTGKDGYLKQGYKAVLGEEKGNIAYYAVDTGLSIVSLNMPVKNIETSANIFGFGKIYSERTVREFETMTGRGLMFEGALD